MAILIPIAIGVLLLTFTLKVGCKDGMVKRPIIVKNRFSIGSVNC
jgi:hypothetical protein